MVLQWLVYALWGWTVFSLSWLVALVVGQLIEGGDEGSSRSMYGEGISYLLAAVIVLFIIALVSDIFYARAERKHTSTTGTNVIMIIHAVIFALFGIAALIASVFGGVSLMVGDATNTSEATSTIITGAIIFVLYGATLLRTLRPRWIKGVAPLYWVFMAVTVVISIALGVMGPAAQARLAAQDEIIENNLPSLAESINAHAKETGSLPKSLNELTNLDEYGDGDDVKKLIDSNRVTYTPGERLTNDSRASIQTAPESSQMGGTVQTAYHYELCVTYETSSGSSYSYPARDSGNEQQYDTYISTYGHPKGEKCYDIQTEYLY
jgi:ABC-type multidrug transport system fused ATPase/permease subunit